MMSTKRLALWIALAAVLVHVGIGAGGVWSFEPLNYDDPQVLALAETKTVREILTEPTWYAYKPIYFLSVKIDTIFGGAAPGVAHVHNLLLHGLATFLLVLVLSGLLGNRWLAGAAGLLFAVHPVHVESVAWIAGRKDVLSLVLVLLGHLLYRRARDRGRYPWATPILLALGGLAKGTVWIWAAVLLVDEIAARSKWRDAALRLLPCVLVGLAGVTLDVWMGIEAGPGAVDHGVSTFSLAAAMAGVYARYIGNLGLPLWLSLDYGISPDGSWASPIALLGLAAFGAAVALFVISWRRGWTWGLVAAGVWLIGLLPINNIWPRTAILMADRYLYLPAIGAYVLLAALLFRWRTGRNVAIGGLVLAFGVLGVLRTQAFQDSEHVWVDATRKSPESAIAFYQSAEAAGAERQWELALTRAERAFELADRPEIKTKAGLLLAGAEIGRLSDRYQAGHAVGEEDLSRLGKRTTAVLRLAMELGELPLVKQDPSEVQAEAYVLAGQVYELHQNPARALDSYHRAVTLWPRHAAAHHNLATLLISTRADDALVEAEAHLRQALRTDPSFLEAQLQLTNVLALQGRGKVALQELDRAERRHGMSADILFARAQIHLAGRQDVRAAERLLTDLQRLWPDDPRARRLLGDIHLAHARLLLEKGRSENDAKALKGALARFDEAAKTEARRWEAEVGAGDVLLELGRYRQARKRYTQAFERSPGKDWIHRLVARSAMLEAAWIERHAEDDYDRSDAAHLVAEAVRSPVARIDLGLLPLQEELPYFARVAESLDAYPQEAEAVLRATALAITGDEEGARRRLRTVLDALGPDTEAKDVLDGALLLRGLLRDRSRELDDARRDYRLLEERRPGDPLPRVRLLALALREAMIERQIAVGDPDDRERITKAYDRIEGIANELRQVADAHPALLSAGLLVTEAEMQQQRWVPALKRLNALFEHHEKDPAVLRGQSAVYVAQYYATRGAEALKESVRTLTKALLVDPRDPRTYLDASAVARSAGDLRLAVKHAETARDLELLPNGPAARSLADLHLAIGNQALDGGDGQRAMQAADRAAKVAPGSAGPWILRGRLYLKSRKGLDQAFDAFRTAKELEPASLEASKGLADVHLKRARVFQLRRAQSKDQAPRWAARELVELEAVLRLDPLREGADAIQSRIADLRDLDPESRRKRWFESEAIVKEARAFQVEGNHVEALDGFRRAQKLSPNHQAAHLLLAATVYELLRLPGGESDAERKLEDAWLNEAYASLQALDTLDRNDRLYDRHLYRGLLDEILFRRAGTEVMRQAAMKAYGRFLAAAEGGGRKDDEANVTLARKRLLGLEQR